MTAPVALMSAGGGAPVPPGDAGAAGGKPVQGRPKLEKASLTLYDPSPPKSGKPGAEAGRDRLPVQPQGGDDRQDRQVET